VGQPAPPDRRHPNPVAVTVSVRQQILGRFLRVHQADLAGPPPAEPATEPGSEPQRVRVEMAFRSLDAAEALLMLGTDAEVLSPPELRQNLARKAAQAAAVYAATGR
jgi:predicted DNA-binding transcriptional regulator YafY